MARTVQMSADNSSPSGGLPHEALLARPPADLPSTARSSPAPPRKRRRRRHNASSPPASYSDRPILHPRPQCTALTPPQCRRAAHSRVLAKCRRPAAGRRLASTRRLDGAGWRGAGWGAGGVRNSRAPAGFGSATARLRASVAALSALLIISVAAIMGLAL